MRETRRTFVIAMAAAAGSLASPAALLAQRPINPPPPPAPAETQPPFGAGPATHTLDPAKRALLLKNETQFRAGIERLYQMTSELRSEVEKIVTSEVFSVHIYKETEAVEKLAKELKSRLKGVA